MTTLDIIAALIAAVRRNDTIATARLLDALDARLPIEEQVAFLEAIFGEEPTGQGHAVAAAPTPVTCA